jgi:hypothetical protein
MQCSYCIRNYDLICDVLGVQQKADADKVRKKVLDDNTGIDVGAEECSRLGSRYASIVMLMLPFKKVQ